MASSIIKTNGLVKKYGEKAAVNEISLCVEKGDIYGLIGKNGAGKTTLMRLLLGLIDADSGEIRLFDSDNLPASRHRIGSIIEEPGLYYGKTAFENMKTFSLLYDDVTDDEIREILKKVGLENTGKKKVKGFSLGMRQRLGIAIALMGHPELLVLDEPINGLDPAGIKEIRDMILNLNAAGVTFMISSHLLDELGKVVTKYGIMADGELVEEIPASVLRQRCRKHIAVTVDDVETAKRIISESFKNIEISDSEEEKTFCIMSEIDDTSKISSLLVHSGIKLYAMTQQGMTIEDYFIERLGAAK